MTAYGRLKERRQLQFEQSDLAYIVRAAEQAGGISIAELVRRCVRHSARCEGFDPRRAQLPIEAESAV